MLWPLRCRGHHNAGPVAATATLANWGGVSRRGHMGPVAVRGATDSQLGTVAYPCRQNKLTYHHLDGGVAVKLVDGSVCAF